MTENSKAPALSDPRHVSACRRGQPRRYFPDLDGMRGIAVLSVVLFHAGASWLQGGFVGVDIFFVLSGFFITRQLTDDLERGRFSFLKFYERRVRRILPALIFMLAVITALSVIVLVPSDLEEFGGSLLSTLAFVSNMYFWMHTSYFEQKAEYIPLLHTWSLAVEEQFYIFFPIFLLLIWRFCRSKLLHIIIMLALLSYMLSGLITPRATSVGFYFIIIRAWELLVGSAVAVASPAIAMPRLWRNLLSLAGLFLIAASFFWIGPQSSFPGWIAALPVGGCALIIIVSVAGGGIGNFLVARKPLVFVGLISYSLYLWHWPMLALTRYVEMESLRPPMAAAIVALSFALAIFSWRFVERPFRGSNSRVSNSHLVIWSVTAVAALTLCAASLIVLHGIPERFDRKALAYLQQEPNPIPEQCFERSSARVEAGDVCTIGHAQGPVRVAVWGDSHASRIAINLDWLGKQKGFGSLYLAKGSCPPLLGVRWSWKSDFADECAAFDRAAFTKIVDSDVNAVVLAGLWAQYAEGRVYSNRTKYFPLSTATVKSRDDADNRKVFTASLDATVRALSSRGKRVIIVGPIPELDWSAPHRFAAAAQFDEPFPKGPRRKDFLSRQTTVLRVIRHLETLPGVTAVFPHLELCKTENCTVIRNSKLLYFDDNHISPEGNRVLAPMIDDAVSAALTPERTGS